MVECASCQDILLDGVRPRHAMLYFGERESITGVLVVGHGVPRGEGGRGVVPVYECEGEEEDEDLPVFVSTVLPNEQEEGEWIVNYVCAPLHPSLLSYIQTTTQTMGSKHSSRIDSTEIQTLNADP